MASKFHFFTVFLVLVLAFGANAQKPKKPVKKPTSTQKTATQKKPAAQKTTAKDAPAPDAKKDEQKVRDMIAFLQYMLNTLGSSETSARDKDVLVTESYTKIFRDAKVQIEDDLDTDRLVITSKDVPAYLKDVDFFFKDVHFEFTIDNIKSGSLADGKTFYKVTLNRNIQGTNSDGEPVNNSAPRYVEINYDPRSQDLKIVSMYTKGVDEKAMLNGWWRDLSLEWRSIFQKKLNLRDSVSLAELKQLTSITDLDVSGNRNIQNIDPLIQLMKLRTLNVSNTSVSDLSPIRNLTDLTEVNISGTKVSDLSPLRYSSNLVKLDVHHTPVMDIQVVEKMVKLQYLDAGATAVSDFSALTNLIDLRYLNVGSTQFNDVAALGALTQLTEVNFSSSGVKDISALRPMRNLSVVNLDSTQVSDVSVLSGADKLTILHINSTQVADIRPLSKLPMLQKIYSDQNRVTPAVVDAFRNANSRVLIIYDSNDLNAWWGTLSDAWRQVISKAAKLSASPSKEELATINHLDSINISGNTSIRDLEPLARIKRLEVIIADKSSIKDLTPLKELEDVLYLDVSDTEVADLSPLSAFFKLRTLRADQTKIEHITPLVQLKTLERIYVDRTAIHDITALEFMEKNPNPLLVYKTVHLKRWWTGLTGSWKQALRTQMGQDTTATRENLHRLVERENVTLKDVMVNDLAAFSEFVRLKELSLSGTAISDLAPLGEKKTLKTLVVKSSPLQKIEALGLLTELEEVDISNTPIDDLAPIATLSKLRKLNCSGTQIKRLDPLEGALALEELDCSNTFVSKLEPLEKLPLKTLKCYNTKIPNRRIEDFKANKPDCNVIYYR